MAAVQGTDGQARVYMLVCSRAGCPVYYNPPVAIRHASDTRRWARSDGWYAPVSKRKRGHDLCPDCR